MKCLIIFSLFPFQNIIYCKDGIAWVAKVKWENWPKKSFANVAVHFRIRPAINIIFAGNAAKCCYAPIVIERLIIDRNSLSIFELAHLHIIRISRINLSLAPKIYYKIIYFEWFLYYLSITNKILNFFMVWNVYIVLCFVFVNLVGPFISLTKYPNSYIIN